MASEFLVVSLKNHSQCSNQESNRIEGYRKLLDSWLVHCALRFRGMAWLVSCSRRPQSFLVVSLKNHPQCTNQESNSIESYSKLLDSWLVHCALRFRGMAWLVSCSRRPQSFLVVSLKNHPQCTNQESNSIESYSKLLDSWLVHCALRFRGMAWLVSCSWRPQRFWWFL